MIPRGDYFQCGYVVEKGGADKVKAAGLPALRKSIEAIAPMMKGRTGGLKRWDDIHLLTVAIDRLERWSAPGVLCIGDAAHAMSPIGGVGINLAVQDAVATANILAPCLRQGSLTLSDLQDVQRRREWPTRVIQTLQVFIQNNVVAPTLKGSAPKPPWPAKLLDRTPWMQGIPAKVVGVGVRYEHVRIPDVHVA
jgi:2-polyprenyl-6-methoxyphenol hydroxylase-like FAD-dependent oxidoreductase